MVVDYGEMNVMHVTRRGNVNFRGENDADAYVIHCIMHELVGSQSGRIAEPIDPSLHHDLEKAPFC